MAHNRRAWTEWQDLVLKRALMEGGFPLARQRLPYRSAQSIYDRANDMGYDLYTLGPVKLASALEVAAELGISDHNARRVIHADPLSVRRGSRHLAVPQCRLQAILAERPPEKADVKDGTLLTAEEAAARLGVSVGHFRHRIGPRALGDVRREVIGTQSARQYLYPLEAVADLARAS